MWFFFTRNKRNSNWIENYWKFFEIQFIYLLLLKPIYFFKNNKTFTAEQFFFFWFFTNRQMKCEFYVLPTQRQWNERFWHLALLKCGKFSSWYPSVYGYILFVHFCELYRGFWAGDTIWEIFLFTLATKNLY